MRTGSDHIRACVYTCALEIRTLEQCGHIIGVLIRASYGGQILTKYSMYILHILYIYMYMYMYVAASTFVCVCTLLCWVM